MLRTLDPHSNFFDPKDLEVLREDQSGHYYGVGMTVQGRNGKTIVMAPFVGSPAYKAGLRPGDVIIKVNDKPTDNLDSTKVADLLKGPRGTPVQIVVLREGVDKPMMFNIIRDEISRKSVPDALLVKPGIGYVDLEQFNETTSHEMEEALKKLDEDNIKGLVLDLREQSRRAAERSRRGGRSFPAEGRRDRFAQRPRFAGASLHRAQRQPRPRLSDRGAGEPQFRFGRRDRFRRPAGSRPRLDSGRQHVRQRSGADGLSAGRRTPAWR